MKSRSRRGRSPAFAVVSRPYTRPLPGSAGSDRTMPGTTRRQQNRFVVTA
ncbi:hypothetical protein SGL43_02812 [Streptomyces globisporus]|uniref:Uncharacterized protein n=1 Tax=Streptomyces globisporus TaxID=1908 RepID=A0ABM9GYF6_STRGL|nr:hypothetical protein SGL43_02812 [Streptomyces globisporus]